MENKNVFGMYGLGVMGRNLLLNMADHGYTVAGFNRHNDKVDTLKKEAKDMPVQGFYELDKFVDSLASPKTIMILVTAGDAVDKVIDGLLPLLDKGDIIIDGGNSHFIDTARRSKDLEDKGFHFIGMGVSGGEQGARRGPSMMPGGDEEAYKTVQDMLEKAAAHVNGEPTITYLGPGAAGHYVKMVHNGIEYALMQLISETYEVMRKGLHLDHYAVHDVYKAWNDGRLQSFLLEISRDIFTQKNVDTGHFLLDDIKDEAMAKGTGKWTSQGAMDIDLPTPIIDTAVSLRDLSRYKDLRTEASKKYPDTKEVTLTDDHDAYLDTLENAFYFAMAVSFSQGMHLLDKASKEYNYGLKLDQIAKIWRGGCIIRAAFLEEIYSAYEKDAELGHLLLDDKIASDLRDALPHMRKLVSDAAKHGIAVPAFASALNYFDALRSEQMPANLIQAQRDYFGAHTYELIGKEGVFHTEWRHEDAVSA